MMENILIMSGYGAYVWLSFGITIIVCLVFYLKTKATLKKYEKEFVEELNNLSYAKKRLVMEKSNVASRILISQNKTA